MAETRRRATEEGVLLAEERIRWQDATPWLAAAWSSLTLVEILGPEAYLLPAGLHPLPLILFPPAWVIHALSVQRDIFAPTAAFADHVSEILLAAVDTHTVSILRSDVEFMRAYRFAAGGE